LGSAQGSSVRWFVAAMVGGFAFVSYVERMNISVAAELMMPDLSLSQTAMGHVFSSFLLGYAIFQVPAGRIGDAVGPRVTLAVAAVIWGATTALTGLLPNLLVRGSTAILASLLILRFLLGAGEAATFPVGTRAIRNWTPPPARALGNSLMVAGSSLAAAITAPLVSWLMVQMSWRSAFYMTSLLAFAIALVWYLSVTDDPAEDKHVSASELDLITRQVRNEKQSTSTPLSKLLTNRNILILSLSYICEGYVLFIFVFWLYIYLVEVREFSMLKGGMVASLPWLAALMCTPLGGLTCDRMSAKIGRIGGARAVIMLGYGLSGALLFVAAKSESRTGAVAALCVSVGFLYFAEPAFWATAAHLSGESAGAVSGIMNTAGIIGGIVSTSLIPVIVKHFGWIPALGSGAAVAVACTCAWFMIGGKGLADKTAVSVKVTLISPPSWNHGLGERRGEAKFVVGAW
jgi:ACS family glucarate transporter-like MFS transporter